MMEGTGFRVMFVLLLLIVMFAIFVGIIVLQVFLSKKDSKWFGLILPGTLLFFFTACSAGGDVFHADFHYSNNNG